MKEFPYELPKTPIDDLEEFMKALGDGSRFAAFVEKLMKEGYDKEAAEKIAAAKGREAHGSVAMNRWAKKGRKK